MVGCYYWLMSAIGVLFQLRNFFNTDLIFTFLLIAFVISVLFLCYLYEKCVVM